MKKFGAEEILERAELYGRTFVDENKENGALYMVMDSAPYEAYPYVSFSSEFGYIVVVPDADETTLPAGYKAGTLDIEGKGSIGAYYYGKDKDVCLVYAINNEGNYGWYLYDVNERTYMRYLGNSEADREEIQVPGTEAQSGDVQKLESQNRMIFWAFLIVCYVFSTWVFNRLKGHFADVL